MLCPFHHLFGCWLALICAIAANIQVEYPKLGMLWPIYSAANKLERNYYESCKQREFDLRQTLAFLKRWTAYEDSRLMKYLTESIIPVLQTKVANGVCQAVLHIVK